jgi:5-methylcytosine-specific restriction endonuclease McrA
MVPEKACSKCKIIKPAESFGKCSKERTGLKSRCKECRRDTYLANSENFKEKQRAYYRRKKDGPVKEINYIRGGDVKARQIEAKRRYADRNKDKLKACRLIWFAANHERLRECWREYAQKNLKRINAYHREYRRRKPEFEQSKRHARRARKKAGGRFTPAEFKALCEQYEGKCLACGCTPEKLSPDHVIPLSKGGMNTIDNIQPLCLICNIRKGAKTIDYRHVTDST